MGSRANFVRCSLVLVGEEQAVADQVGVCAALHLLLEHLDAVEVAFDDAGIP